MPISHQDHARRRRRPCPRCGTCAQRRTKRPAGGGGRARRRRVAGGGERSPAAAMSIRSAAAPSRPARSAGGGCRRGRRRGPRRRGRRRGRRRPGPLGGQLLLRLDLLFDVGAVRRLRDVAQVRLVEVDRALVVAGLAVRLRQVEEERRVVLQLVRRLELLDRVVVAAEVVERRAAVVVLLRGRLVVRRLRRLRLLRARAVRRRRARPRSRRRTERRRSQADMRPALSPKPPAGRSGSGGEDQLLLAGDFFGRDPFPVRQAQLQEVAPLLVALLREACGGKACGPEVPTARPSTPACRLPSRARWPCPIRRGCRRRRARSASAPWSKPHSPFTFRPGCSLVFFSS